MTQAALWTSEEAAAATGGRNTAAWRASGVSIDSRSLESGDLFVALAGPNHDGHDYIAKAFAAGAAAALSHRTPGDAAGGPLLMVEDTMTALWRLGAAARARSGARFLAVTGSVGKTSTKEALARCLRAQAPTAASAASYNNHWGVPLSLARMARDSVYGVFEVGMNHPGEIRELTGLLRPDVALVTNVELAHIGYFESVEQIADAKAEIFEGMTPEGVAVLNRDNPHYPRLAERARACGLTRILGFGRDAAADARLIDCTPEADGSVVRAEVLGETIDYRISLPGTHWVINSLGVLAAVAAIGASTTAAAAQFASLTALPGRGARRRLAFGGGAVELIDDSYNANPTSMRAAFEVLARALPGSGGRRVAVLGDMLELGAEAEALHRALAAPLDQWGIDLVFACGPAMAALFEVLPPARRGAHAADSQSLAPLVAGALRPGDVVLVKGSLGSRMARVVAALQALDETASAALPQAANGN